VDVNRCSKLIRNLRGRRGGYEGERRGELYFGNQNELRAWAIIIEGGDQSRKLRLMRGEGEKR